MESSEITLQQRTLAYGALHEKPDAVTSYDKGPNGERVQKHFLADTAMSSLVEKFRQNPKDCLASCRQNLLAINKDPQLSPTERKDRLDRYLDAYFGLVLQLDHSAFPPSAKVQQGVPDYIPDGLSDMGSDQEVDPRKRSREKIRVNKKEIFEQYKKVFMDVFSADFSKASPDQIKDYMVKMVATAIYNSQPYDHQNMGNLGRLDQSVPITDIAEKKFTVCRHHALYTQVLLQTFGLTSKLLKSEVDFGDTRGFGSHVNNLVRINNHWNLLDTTNPETKPDGVKQVLLKPIPQTSIDVAHNNYEWQIQSGKNRYTYKSRNNMYYRIMDNSKPL